MKIGMSFPVMVPGLDRDLVHAWARRTDQGPFSCIASGERINFPNPEVMVTLATAAAVTERVKILFDVSVTPMHSPVLLAKQVATLDVMSGGRVVLGVGVGGREEDYAAVGAEFGKTRFRRLEEGVATMRRIWRGEKVVESALRPVEPLPVQAGGPEILAGSLFPRSIRRAARFADGLKGFSFGPSVAEVQGAFDLARAAWKEEGRPEPRLSTGFWFSLGSDGREKMDAYVARYLNFMGPDAPKKIAPTVRCVDAATLRDATREMEDLGCDELVLVPTTLDPDEIDRVVDALSL
ncbi:MAG: LLM class flavin-dependent oxidoreductase [Deltaproteobacteria bacterium]|nr:LLM class flavin-dependent oxidoreductase [Deltaproteobacteria bacterium]